MAPSRKRSSSRTNNRAVTLPKKQKPNQSSVTLNATATDENCNEAESSALSNENEIFKEQCTSTIKSQKFKDEPQEINIKCAPNSELARQSGTPTDQIKFHEAVKAVKSVAEDDEPQNVIKEMDGKKSVCLICGRSYSCNSHLNRHQKKAHGTIIRVTTSSETDVKTENVEKKTEEKSEERRFSCQCGRSYTNNSNLKRHKKTCAPDTSVDNQDDSVTSLTEDKESELIKPYVCVCGKSYTCSSHLYRHQKTHQEGQGSPERRYVCECGKSYSCSSHLNRHQRTHGEPNVLKVEQNDVKVEETENLEQKGKPYLCFCGKSYTCSSHLYRHQKIHPELNVAIREKCMIKDGPLEKRFQCKCGKSYTCRSHLNRHQKTHQEQVFIAQNNDCDGSEAAFQEVRQKPFVCECGKKFILSFSLLLHKKIHCRWKPSNSDSGPPGH